MTNQPPTWQERAERNGLFFNKGEVEFIADLLKEQEQEFRKTLNSGRKMYWLGVEDGKKNLVMELREVRLKYDNMELEQTEGLVTWRGGKMVRNVITDRIEELTRERQ